MKIVCSKAELTKGINIVSKAVSTKTTMSILQCILIDASTDSIKLVANDMELAIETIIEGNIETRGAIAIDAKTFSEFVHNIQGEDIVIETVEDGSAVISSGKYVFDEIEIKPAEDFSNIPAVSRNTPVVISQFTFRDAVNKTIFSISDNEKNKIMTGELFEIEGDKLKIVSLDGFRVSMINIGLRESYESKRVIIPGKTLREITKIVTGDVEDELLIYTTDNHIIFEFENTTVVSRLIEGEYFKIAQMIPQYFETEVKVNRKELLDCINSASLLSREGDLKPINLDIKDDNINLFIKSNRAGFKGDVEADKEGADLRIAFKPKFIQDVLKVIDDEEINIHLIDKKSPCVIKDEEENYIYMILPVNTN